MHYFKTLHVYICTDKAHGTYEHVLECRDVVAYLMYLRCVQQVRALAGARCTGSMLYKFQIKVGTGKTSARIFELTTGRRNRYYTRQKGNATVRFSRYVFLLMPTC